MKTILKIAALTPAVVLLFLVDVPPETPLGVRLVPEAHAILGVWRRHARRWAVISTAAAATTATAAAASESAAAQQQAAAAQQQAAAAPPPPPATGGKPLPLGTVVSSLPSGCTSTPVGGVDYFYCGGSFYRAVFQGNQLVYVTAKP